MCPPPPIIDLPPPLDFYQEIHGTQTFFLEITASRKLRHSLPTSRLMKQSFLNILSAYLSRSVVSMGREKKIRRSMLCPWLASINQNINFKTTIFLYLFRVGCVCNRSERSQVILFEL